MKFNTKLQMLIKCIEYNQCRITNTCIHIHMNYYLTKCVLSFLNRNKISYITVSWKITITCLLDFQQTLLIEAWLLSCLWFRIKTLRGLGYTMTHSISRGSNSTVNDNVHDKTSDSFTHKESDLQSHGEENWI